MSIARQTAWLRSALACVLALVFAADTTLCAILCSVPQQPAEAAVHASHHDSAGHQDGHQASAAKCFVCPAWHAGPLPSGAEVKLAAAYVIVRPQAPRALRGRAIAPRFDSRQRAPPIFA